MKNSTLSKTARNFFHEHKGIIIVMAALLLIRLIIMYDLGFMYSIDSDDGSYIKSGIVFANTGTITMHDQYPSAQIMPGMTWIIGFFSLIFGEGKALWIVLKLVWITMGTTIAWFIYRTVCVYAPKWCGIAAACCLFGAEYIWMDNVILTETPTMLCLSMMIYFTVQMSRSSKKRYFIGCLVAYMCAFMLKANFGIYPLFAAIFLLFSKYSWKRLLKQGLILGCAMLCFIIPWSIRNYIQFDAFIPLTYGSGNPMLLGTYQGRGIPSDDELDYETNVEDVVKKNYAKYFDENGEIQERYERYINLIRDDIKAKYRLREWFKREPLEVIYSTLVTKAQVIVDNTFYGTYTVYNTKIFDIGIDIVNMLQRLNTIICVAVVSLSLYFKRYRRPILFTLMVYLGNVYIYATTFAYGRYNAALMPIRFIMIGIGFALFAELLGRAIKAKHVPDAVPDATNCSPDNKN